MKIIRKILYTCPKKSENAYQALSMGGNCLVLRWVAKEENFVFNDEEKLISFIRKSEGKKHQDNKCYEIGNGDFWDEVTTIWNLDYKVSRSYQRRLLIATK